MDTHPDSEAAELDVLIVGAGPTGLALAAQLRSFGVRFRIIDRLLDRARESRALAVQARTLEVLQGVDLGRGGGKGLGEQLVDAGRTGTRLVLHIEDRVAQADLGGFGVPDTRFPFILFISQAETERIFNEHLRASGSQVERGVELVDFLASDTGVECTLRGTDGREERVRAAYLAGCDGAHSTVRKKAGISFEGGAYLQDFMLGDVEADGSIERGAIHSFAGRHGVAMFFPLGAPRTWRVVAIAPDRAREERRHPRRSGAATEAPMTSDLSLAELQTAIDGATGEQVRLSDPAWLSHFRLHHRQAGRYRTGRVFLAGDAGHIHSPVGAQGMNTGIQDAWNLGWKLALTVRGLADERLLDSYEAERWPVGRKLLDTTDRVFGLFTRVMSSSALAAWFRREVVYRVLPRVLSSPRLRTYGFGFISQLRIRYRDSPVVTEGRPDLAAGPKAGDRLPDAPLTRDGQPTHLQRELSGPFYHLLLCGGPDGWDRDRLADLTERSAGALRVCALVRRAGAPDALVAPSEAAFHGELVDPSGEALERLGVRNAAQYLVRPDGYIAFRCAGRDLAGIGEFLGRLQGTSH